ncbi:MAG: YceI family protein [Crocinitomicaceae bacterium]|nr:YceI family protein [Crocinitomicaceae bacterium]
MATNKWVIDPSHSEVMFKVKHLMISNVTGVFNGFQGGAATEEDDFSTAQFEFSAPINAISTNNEQRDGHLKSADFFDAENYPELTFKSKKVEKVDDDTYSIIGDFTIKGVTNEAKLKMEFGGITKDPYGNTKAGFSLNGKINRADYGLTWNAALETGGVMVSEDVRLNADIQLVKQ